MTAATDLSAVERTLPPGPRWQGRAARRWLSDIGSLLLECRDRYGDAFTLPAPGVHGPRPTRAVVLSNPADVYDVLRSGSDRTRAGNCRARVLQFTGPESVLILEGEQHAHRRKIMFPAFHRRAVERLGTVMTRMVDEEVDAWPLEEPFSMAKGLSAITFGILSRTVFGEAGYDLAWRAQLGQAVRGIAQPWVGPRVVDKENVAAHTAMDRLLYEQIALARANPSEERDDVLALFVAATDEDGQPLEDGQIRDELMTMLLAGHDSVAITLTWAFEEILRDPAVAAWIREELPTGETARIDAAIHETLRLHPPLPLVARTLAVPWTLGGHELAAGTVVIASVWLANRSPEVYEDADVFKVDRFLGSPPDPQTWMPFGAGARRCVGGVYAHYQVRTVLQRILARTDIELRGTAPGYGKWRMVGLWPGSAPAVLHRRDAVSPTA